jgi:hypothetical protein
MLRLTGVSLKSETVGYWAFNTVSNREFFLPFLLLAMALADFSEGRSFAKPGQASLQASPEI